MAGFLHEQGGTQLSCSCFFGGVGIFKELSFLLFFVVLGLDSLDVLVVLIVELFPILEQKLFELLQDLLLGRWQGSELVVGADVVRNDTAVIRSTTDVECAVDLVLEFGVRIKQVEGGELFALLIHFIFGVKHVQEIALFQLELSGLRDRAALHLGLIVDVVSILVTVFPLVGLALLILLFAAQPISRAAPNPQVAVIVNRHTVRGVTGYFLNHVIKIYLFL